MPRRFVRSGFKAPSKAQWLRCPASGTPSGNFIIIYPIDTIHKQCLSLGVAKVGRLFKKADLFYGRWVFVGFIETGA